jgi:ATP-binding cassette subfamily C (CFTR/MRP) protein 1
MLTHNDTTEIGERGINLSGGQKQRVSIARAIYSDADIYLFDGHNVIILDSLNAVDAHVGNHIFEKVLGKSGLLKKKVRIFVTHGINFLPDASKIMTMKDGKIAEQGTYDELINLKGAFYTLMKDFGKQKKEVPENEPGIEKSFSQEFPKQAEKTPNKEKVDNIHPNESKIINKEESATGSVSMKVYSEYASSCGVYSVLVFLVIAVFTQVLQVSQNIFLSMWADSNDRGLPNNFKFWLLGYAVIGFSSTGFIIFQVIYVWIYCGYFWPLTFRNSIS